MKKGFTLLELLAVIIILAVIALIVTPVVFNVVDEAKKSAFQDSAYSLINAIELKSMEDMLDGNNIIKDYIFPNDSLAIKGKLPNGSASVDSEGRIQIAIHDGKWCAIKDFIDDEITLQEYEEGKCLIGNPEFTAIGREFTMLNGDGMYFVVNEELGIDFMLEGTIQASIPKECVTKTDDTVIVTGFHEDYNGTYNFYKEGYVKYNDMIVAKAKDSWITVEEGSYIIVLNDEFYISEDGNTGVFAGTKDEIGEAINLFLSEFNSENVEIELLEAIGYEFTPYNGELKVTHFFDMLEALEIQYDGFVFSIDGYYRNNWGGVAKGEETENSYITTAYWPQSEVYTKEETVVYKITNNSKVKMNINENLTNGVYAFYSDYQYYYNDELTDNIFTVMDVPWAYDDGMTYREWIHSEYSQNGAYLDWRDGEPFVYIPEQYLDSPCGTGSLETMTGFLSFNGFGGSETYCTGEMQISQPSLESALGKLGNTYYTYQGEWYGFGEKLITSDTIMSYDIYNYFIRNALFASYGEGSLSVFSYSAFKKSTNAPVVDISKYLYRGGYYSGNYNYSFTRISVDKESLMNDLGMPNSAFDSMGCIAKDNDLFVLLSTDYDYVYSSNFTESGFEIKDDDESGHFQNRELGVIFYYDGVYYEGWISQ